MINVEDVAKHNPEILIGGFNVDVVIIHMIICLGNEFDENGDPFTDEEIHKRIRGALQGMYPEKF